MDVNTDLVALSTVQEQFCVEDKKKAVEMIVDAFRENMNINDAIDLLLTISKRMAEALETEGVAFTPIEKMTWVVKEAFIAGAAEATDKMMTMNEEIFKDLVDELTGKEGPGQ